ncbi:hypothetical protein SDC9_60309 [bioreactor metagenome]|uniref:Uncharacterized protein n=1 Tax=bioreactor metagenome TaxID=1076179 RepID=A0A644XCX8_9ZZZZ
MTTSVVMLSVVLATATMAISMMKTEMVHLVMAISHLPLELTFSRVLILILMELIIQLLNHIQTLPEQPFMKTVMKQLMV